MSDGEGSAGARGSGSGRGDEEADFAPERVKEMFRDADVDKDGFISREELEVILGKIGEFDTEDFEILFEESDRNSDGKLSYEEFIDYCLSAGMDENEGSDASGAGADEKDMGWSDEDETYMDEWELEDQYEDDEFYDEEDISYMDTLEDAEIDVEAKVTRDAFKVIYVKLGYPKAEADEEFEYLATEAAEEGTSSGPDEGIPVLDLLWALDIETSDAEMMLEFKEAWESAKAVVAGEAEMPEEQEEPIYEALEGAEVERPRAAASGLNKIAAYLYENDLSVDEAPTLIENNAANNELGLSNKEQAAVNGLSSVQERLGKIMQKPPALQSNVGAQSCNESCKKKMDQFLAQCAERGEKFSDVEWDVMNNPASVLWVDKQAPGFESTVSQPAVWKRLTELIDTPVLFKNDAKACDIIQGGVGTCWMLGAMGAMVSNCPKTFKKLFIKHDIENGIYGVRFCVQGEWKYVIVDDYMPVDEEGSLLYASCKDPQEVWAPLLEKAFCKLYTCYEMCDGGNENEAVIHFYGGVGGCLKVTDEHRGDPSRYFEVLKRARKKGYLLCTGFCNPEGEKVPGTGKCGEAKLPYGLVDGHAYSVLRVVEAEGNQLICCRNPWGEGEWTGAWSDKNENGEWTDEMKAACGWTDEDDGTFWMGIGDFVANCGEGASYARTFSPKWKKVTKLSRFSKTSLKAKAIADYEGEEEDDLCFATGEIITVDEMSGGWWFGKKSDGSSGGFPSENVKLLKRPVARFDLSVTPTSEDKDVKAVVMLMQPNVHFKRKFFKRKEDGMNEKDTEYPSMTLIAMGPDGKKVWHKSECGRCIWGDLKLAKGSVGKYQIYALSTTGSAEKFSIRVYAKNANPALTDSPGATIADLKSVLRAEGPEEP